MKNIDSIYRYEKENELNMMEDSINIKFSHPKMIAKYKLERLYNEIDKISDSEFEDLYLNNFVFNKTIDFINKGLFDKIKKYREWKDDIDSKVNYHMSCSNINLIKNMRNDK